MLGGDTMGIKNNIQVVTKDKQQALVGKNARK